MTTQEKILIALDDEYKAYSFYNKAMQLYGMPFVNLFQSEANHINALSLHLQNLNVPIPQNPYEDIVIPNTLSGALEVAIENENQNIALYNSLIEGEQDSLVLDTFYRLQAASFNNHIPSLFNALNANTGLLDKINNGRALLGETGEIVAQLQNGELTQGQLEAFLNKLNYSLMGGMILGAFGAIILNEFLNQNKE
ncbi:ferritin-like domain-containing protein [Helicobacter pullorum]|uniref:ferritin-like domain-containing protein n=1 Tax=Helicobacter pullorum TaxID=35818 RepID=UPI001065CD62|nr:hypothetical protein [Helicobacter pullorum]